MEVPFVSVIVPVKNAPNNVKQCIEALQKQTYPSNRYEIIIVDNDSKDETAEIIKDYSVTYLLETSMASPYPARNLGINHSKGEIIALTDSDCTPVTQWLEIGVNTLKRKQADLIGGHVTFTFSPQKTAAEIFDSISNLEVKNNIKNKGVAKTGNLIFRRSVIDKIGLFPDSLRSGGDVLWTGRASREGFRLVYAEEVKVQKPARTLHPLLKKQYRVGYGHPVIWIDQKQSWIWILGHIIRGFFPRSPWRIKKMIQERGSADMNRQFLSIYFVSWLCLLFTNFGRIYNLIKLFFKQRKDKIYFS